MSKNYEPCYRVVGLDGHFGSFDIAIAAAKAADSYVVKPVWCTCMVDYSSPKTDIKRPSQTTNKKG